MNTSATVQPIDAAFGRGDGPAILGRLAEDAEREDGASAAPVPGLPPLQGRDPVPKFVEAPRRHFNAAGRVQRFRHRADTWLQPGSIGQA